jgi:hypothetical protein
MASVRWSDDATTRRRTAIRPVLVAAVVVLAFAGCSDAGDATAVDTTASGDVAGSAVTVAERTGTSAGVTSVPIATTAGPASTTSATTAPQATAAPTTAPITTPTTMPPDVLQRQPGVAPVEVRVSGADPTRPTFSWDAVPGASGYQVVVHAGDGSPLWAWTGAATSVPLGGAERGADEEGPTLTGPSSVRVYGFEASGRLVAISGWTSLAG